jgi:hypothetical protein
MNHFESKSTMENAITKDFEDIAEEVLHELK